MRPILLIFLALIALPALAQKPSMGKDMVVKDSSGQVYPYEIWQALLIKGQYKLAPEKPNDENTAFLLVRLTEEEQKIRLENMPKPRPSKSFSDGKRVDLFKAKTLDGKVLDLKAAKGKIVVLNFWFINCRPCRLEMPELNALVDSFRNNDQVIFAAIALDEEDALNSFLKNNPFHYSIIPSGRFLAAQYGVASFPTHAVIDGEGKVYFHTVGLATNTVYWVKKSILELLARQEQDF